MAQVKNVLITGASGLIGKRLSTLLGEKGNNVFQLGRTKKGPNSFVWDIQKKTMDEGAFVDVDAIVHLAGAGVSDKRWTDAYKKEIYNSRIESSRLLFEKLESLNHKVHTVVSASAIGYYGFENETHWFNEDDAPGKDFLAQVTHDWEAEVDKIANLGIRVVKIRIGVVLSRDGGALARMATPVRFLVGASLASGNQPVSWIHIDDLCELFIRAIDSAQFQGAYNGVAPNPVTNRELTEAIASVLHRPLWAPAVPPFALKIILGEMADMVVKGTRISAEKVLNTGFTFKFPTVQQAVEDLLG